MNVTVIFEEVYYTAYGVSRIDLPPYSANISFKDGKKKKNVPGSVDISKTEQQINPAQVK